MKKKNLNIKLNLKKEVISNLNSIKGGILVSLEVKTCAISEIVICETKECNGETKSCTHAIECLTKGDECCTTGTSKEICC